jgi:hypothetical protein
VSDINTYANQAAIDLLTPIAGDLVVNRETNALHLCTNATGPVWKIFTNDSAAIPSFVIDVYETEAQVFALTPEPNYTIVHAKDTDKLYVWNGVIWFIYDNDSTV